MVSVLSVLILLVAVLSSHAFRPIHSINTISTDFQADRDTQSFLAIQSIRGGGDDYDSEYDEYDEESEDEEIVKLSASAKKAMEKVKTKKKAQAKKTVSASLGKTKSKKIKGPSPFKKIPYIVRALMNPFTVFAMTKGYFASLFNIDYLQEDISQNLRSALQEKAKSAPLAGKRARKMKPGQAKTLSDLPQLSA